MNAAGIARWIEPSGPRTLAGVRIVIALQALWIVLSRDPVGAAALPHEVWDLVGAQARVRYFLVPGFPGIELALWCAAAGSLACVLVGFRTRVFGFVAALLLYHLAPLQILVSAAPPWGKGLTIAILALPILACSPCDDHWSLARPPAPARDPAAYGWAVMLVRLLFAQIYLSTALGRLLAGGLDWVSVDAVRTHVLLFRVIYPQLDTPINAWLVDHPAACAAIAGGTLLFEIVFIAAVFFRRVRLPLALAGVAFHVSLWLTLGFKYPNLPHFMLFLDLDGRPAPRPDDARDGAVRQAQGRGP